MKEMPKEMRSLLLRKLTSVCDVSYCLSSNRKSGCRDYVKYEFGKPARFQHSAQRFALIKTCCFDDERLMSVYSWPEMSQLVDFLVKDLTETCENYCDTEIWTFNNVFHELLKDKRIIRLHLQQYYCDDVEVYS